MLRIQILGLAMLMGLPLFAAADERLNIRTNPFMVFGQTVHLELDVRVGEHTAFGPIFLVNGTEPNFDVGLRYSFYEQGTFQQGWLFSAALTGGQEVSEARYSGEFDEVFEGFDTRAVAKLSADQAYFWRWNTFNTTLGLGARLEYHDKNEALELHSNIRFSIGWVR